MKGQHHRRSERSEKKYPYETVRYKCPECGAEASQTRTKEMNELFLKSIEGTFCPDCENKIVH